METRSVSRCVAIAAHGKRCQQSPFRGSPYCWHHTQSRKVWAPSRPLTSTASRPAAPAEVPPAASPVPERRAGVERRAGEDRRSGWGAEDGVGRRIADALGPERAAELLDFLESPADGAYLLVRDESGLLSERSISERPVRRRRPAS
jgi:hypothetical protein